MFRMKLFLKLLFLSIFLSSIIFIPNPPTNFAKANSLRYETTKVELADRAVGDSYEPDNSSGEAKPIASGSPQTHSIVPVGDEDWVTFTLASESEVTLETSGPSGDTYMVLYDSGLTEVEYSDDYNDLFSYIDRECGWDALPAGTYYVSVEDYANDEEIASYDLSFNATPCSLIGDSYEPDNSAAEANPITSGSPQTHSIVPADDEDYVVFTLPVESWITIETSGPTGDTVMVLFDSNIIQIEVDDDGGTDLFSYIDRVCEVDALPAGTYYVAISDYGNDNEIASYDLSFSTSPCPTHQNFLPLVMKGSDPETVFNGDFELGHVSWTESSSSGNDLITNTMPVTPHSGSWLAKFGENNNETDQLSQSVFIPVDKTDLHFWYQVSSIDPLEDFDFFYVRINGTPVRTVTLYYDTQTTNWVEDVVDLSAYAGSTVNLMFEVTTDEYNPSTLYLDDISLEANLNGDFELGHTSWAESSSSGNDLITNTMPVTPHSGSWLAKFGENNNETDQLSQSVFIPVDKTDLHFYYWILSTDDEPLFDWFDVKIDGTAISHITLYYDTVTGDWMELVLDLSFYAGSTVTLMFEVTTDPYNPSTVYLDDVSLESPSP